MRPRALAIVLLGAACGGSAPPPPANVSDVPPAVGATTLAVARTRCATSALAPRALRRLTRGELERSIRDVFPTLGDAWAGVELGPDPVSPVGLANDAFELVVGTDTARELLATAKDVAAVVTDDAHLPGVLPCAASTPDPACAARFVDGVGPRLYRRPLTGDERQELLATFSSVSGRAGFAAGLKWTLVAMLEAPPFVYRSEVGDANGRLDANELATELAYVYGGSTPSADLVAKAARGGLSSPDARVAEARALLATPGGQAAYLDFFRQWSGYDLVLGQDRAGVGDFTASVAPLLAEETRRYLQAMAFDGNRTVSELLTSTTTYLDADLAIFYKYGDGVTDFAPVERPAGKGIGLLAQASLLAARSHYDFTSPTLRGLFVYSRLLCRQPAPPPGGVPPVEPAPVDMTTTRARFESQHEHGTCAACHRTFEPLGYALEHFDAAGVYRVNENGYDIDAHASITLDDGSVLEFDGEEDLARKLAARPDVADCVGGLLASYAFGGAGGQACLAEDARAALAEGRMGLLDYYVSLAGAPSFAERAP